MINICHEFSLKNRIDTKLRVGIHAGTVVAGVMGAINLFTMFGVIRSIWPAGWSQRAL